MTFASVLQLGQERTIRVYMQEYYKYSITNYWNRWIAFYRKIVACKRMPTDATGGALSMEFIRRMRCKVDPLPFSRLSPALIQFSLIRAHVVLHFEGPRASSSAQVTGRGAQEKGETCKIMPR